MGSNKNLYHIKVYNHNSFLLQHEFEKKDIESYIGDGGIHLNLNNFNYEKANDIACSYNLKIENGMLPEVQLQILNTFKQCLHQTN